MRFLKKMTATVLAVFLLAAPCFAAVDALIPGGEAVGLELELTMPCIRSVEDGKPAAQAGLKAGDQILSVNAQTIRDLQELAEMIGAGMPLIVSVRRGGKEMSYTVYPEKTEDGWRIGAEVTDRICGIGTVTYYDPSDNRFGALGHGVDLPERAQPLPITGGTAAVAEVTSVEKSEPGEPGQLKGRCLGQTVGTVCGVTDSGVFGTFFGASDREKRIPVAESSQVHTGDAVIRCSLSGTQVREYSVRISEVYPQSENGRDLLLTVTDRELLSRTGGIVRGMSGSPIIQDGRLIGAVTHVLVDEPRKGYGILVKKMLAAQNETECRPTVPAA